MTDCIPAVRDTEPDLVMAPEVAQPSLFTTVVLSIVSEDPSSEVSVNW